MSRNLYDIQEEYMLVLQELEDYFLANPDQDELPDWIYERLNVNKNEMGDKLTHFYLWRKQLESEEENLKARQEEWQKKRKAKQKTIEKIKQLTNTAVKLYGEVNIKSKGVQKSKVVLGNDMKFTYIYAPAVIVNPITISRDFLIHNIEIEKLTEAEYNDLADYMSGRGLKMKSLSSSPDKDRIKTNLEAGYVVEGASLDKEAGYVRAT